MRYANYQDSREQMTRVTAEGGKRQEGSFWLGVCCGRVRRASGRRRQTQN